MAYRDNSIIFGGDKTEIDCLQEVIDYLTGLDSRITCDTTSAAQFADLTSASTATFDFNFDNQFTFRIQRSANNATAGKYYYFQHVFDGVVTRSTTRQLFYQDVYPTDIIRTKQNNTKFYLRFTTIFSVDFMFLWSAEGLDSPPSGVFPSAWAIALISDQEGNYYTTSNSYNTILINTSFIKCSDGTGGYTYLRSFANTYCDAGHIGYVENAPFMSSNVIRFRAKDILGCTVLSMGTSIALPNGKNYISIDNNAMISIDD